MEDSCWVMNGYNKQDTKQAISKLCVLMDCLKVFKVGVSLIGRGGEFQRMEDDYKKSYNKDWNEVMSREDFGRSDRAAWEVFVNEVRTTSVDEAWKYKYGMSCEEI